MDKNIFISFCSPLQLLFDAKNLSTFTNTHDFILQLMGKWVQLLINGVFLHRAENFSRFSIKQFYGVK